jgi:hypothetical protein
MRIGILGSGDVAKSLGRGFLKEGRELGGIGLSHYLEATAMIWIITAFTAGHWNQAFKLLRK